MKKWRKSPGCCIMNRLFWTVTLEGQPPVIGSIPAEGEVRINIDVPSGTIKAITAHLYCPMEKTEKAFFNGYQSWSWSPEVVRDDRQRGVDHIPKLLLKQYSFDRYGDYHFWKYPRKKGCFHGYSYGYIRHEESYRLFASLDDRLGYTIFSYDANTGEMTITRDCAGVHHPGGVLSAFSLYFAEGTENSVFDGWFAAMGCRPRTTKKLAGYTSWYNRYEAITEQDVRNDLAGCCDLMHPGDLFQIDDGWEPHVGDWTKPDMEKFPGGMKALSDTIHESGFMSGLWLAPFVCTEKSSVFRNHPDWLLKVEGKPWKCGCNWGGFYALDIDVPAVQVYLAGVFDRVFTKWNFDLVKLDFLYAAAPFGTADESRAGRMYRAMELLRKWCGDKLILGCGVPLMPAFGLVDYCRIGCDVSLDWDDVLYMRAFHRERVSTRHSLDNTLYRRQLSGRAFGNDPDVFFLRKENCKLTPAQKKQLAETNAQYGQVLLISDDPSSYTEEMRREYERVRGMWDKEL